MTLQEIIEQGKNITSETPEYYFWLDNVEQYLNSLPTKSYLDQATAAINDCKEHGENSILRKRGTFKIVAVLMHIYDNEQEKFLHECVSKPLLSIFEDTRVSIVKEEFELSIQFKNEGRYKQSVTEMCKSLESMMKDICKYRGITYDEKDTFNKLVNILKDNRIIPLNGMVDGHQVMRNKNSGHGADEDTYEPTKEDAVLEINRGAALLIYLYEKSGMKDIV